MSTPSGQARHARAIAVAVQLVCAASAAVLFGAGLLRRTAVFARELWLDEAFHNLRLIVPLGFGKMLREIGKDSQPILEYLVRKWLWIPVLGHDERALRLPGMIFSALTMVAVGALSFRYVRRFASATAAALIGVAALAWCAAHPTEIWYAAEARHYALVALASVLWAYFYLLRPPSAWVWPVAFVFANLHFFALAVVLASVPVEVLLAWRDGKARKAAGILAVAVLLGGLYVAVNWYSLAFFAQHTPGERATALHLGESLDLLRGFLAYAALPLVGLGVLALLAAGAAWSVPHEQRDETRRTLARLVVAWSAVAAIVSLARWKSNYLFAERYYTPFFGVAWATMLLGLRAVVARPWPRLFTMAGTALATIGLVAATVFFCRDTAWAHLPSRNFSPVQQFLDEEKARGLPVLMLVEPAYSADVLELYWTAMGHAPAPGSTHALASFGELHGQMVEVSRTALADLRAFVARPGKKTVLLYAYSRSSCATAPGVETHTPRNACIWVLRDPPDIATVKAAADAVSFPWQP